MTETFDEALAAFDQEQRAHADRVDNDPNAQRRHESVVARDLDKGIRMGWLSKSGEPIEKEGNET